MTLMQIVLPLVLILLLLVLASAVRILKEYERGIVFRLGSALKKVKGPGLILMIPFGIDRMVKVDMRIMTMDVPAQDVITRDNVSIKVNAVVYLKVVAPRNAILEVDRYMYATSQLAQTTLRSVCGEKELDTLLTEREAINIALQTILDRHTDPWGVKVTLVELKQIDLPQEMQRAMAAQAEAERGRRAKIIHARGESEAAKELSAAAMQMEEHPTMLQLRYLQVLLEIGTEHNSTTVFPVPIDMFQSLLQGRTSKS
jgi:regulator of protease activity HflC (stomatin/prohibitin superfamily)